MPSNCRASWKSSAGLLAIFLGSAVANPAVRVHVVTIEGMRFVPEVLVVERGDRVTWRNEDPFPHTVTATNKAFDSGNLAAGASWTFVAESTGSYAYGCLLHPTMQGKLVVSAKAHAGDR